MKMNDGMVRIGKPSSAGDRASFCQILADGPSCSSGCMVQFACCQPRRRAIVLRTIRRVLAGRPTHIWKFSAPPYGYTKDRPRACRRRTVGIEIPKQLGKVEMADRGAISTLG